MTSNDPVADELESDAVQRDLGLDVLRATALVLMVAIHYFQRLPSPTLLTEQLNFVGESSAPLFFFAFGLTLAHFQAKPAAFRWQANLMLLCVALSHNLFLWGKLTTVDFLCFLVFWRVFLEAIASAHRPEWIWSGITLATLGIAMAFPKAGVLDSVFMNITDGLFPFLPWGVFVLLGAGFTQARFKDRTSLAVGIVAIALSVALWWIGQQTGRTSLAMSKWPLTPPYVFLFSGVSILILSLFRQLGHRFNRSSRLRTATQFLSENLLLGSVLQYPPLELLYWLTPRISVLDPAKNDEAGVLIAIALGSIACLALLVLLLWLTTAGWDRAAESRIMRNLRAHPGLLALVLLSISAVLCSAPIENWLANDFLARPGKPFAGFAMIVLALELRDWQQRKRKRA